jgi:hypothetical protein
LALPLTLIGLLVLGATVLLTGSTLSGTIMGFMEPAVTRREGPLSQSLRQANRFCAKRAETFNNVFATSQN